MQLPGLQTMLFRLGKCSRNILKFPYFSLFRHLIFFLRFPGMEFEGQPHSGLDDAKNIARIVVRLLKDRAVIRVNEKIQKVAHGVDDSNRCNGKLFSVVPVNRKDAESWIKTQKKKIIKSQNPPSS